jgi:hypothetical protein
VVIAVLHDWTKDHIVQRNACRPAVTLGVVAKQTGTKALVTIKGAKFSQLAERRHWKRIAMLADLLVIMPKDVRPTTRSHSTVYRCLSDHTEEGSGRDGLAQVNAETGAGILFTALQDPIDLADVVYDGQQIRERCFGLDDRFDSILAEHESLKGETY